MVLLGFGVFGAIIGVISSSAISFFISIMQIRWISNTQEKTITEKVSYQKFLPAFVITSVVVIFYSLDVWIARIFFEPEISGAYALASLLGKILFWATVPISKAMLSLSSDSKQEKPKSIFRTALIILVIISLIALIIFFLFPQQLIKFFSGKDVEIGSRILLYEGVSFGLIAIANLILLYKLSVNQIRHYWVMFVPMLSEIVLLAFFSYDIVIFSKVFLLSSAIFLITSLFFYFINRRHE
jgi:O-antigen/teichoic acid export membrane protein